MCKKAPTGMSLKARAAVAVPVTAAVAVHLAAPAAVSLIPVITAAILTAGAAGTMVFIRLVRTHAPAVSPDYVPVQSLAAVRARRAIEQPRLAICPPREAIWPPGLLPADLEKIT